MSKSNVFSTKDKEVIVALVELLSSRSVVGGLTEEEQAYFDEMIKELYEHRGLSPAS